MTYKQTLTPDTFTLDAIADGIRKAPSLMQTAIKRQLPKIRRSALDKLHTQPPPVKKPVESTSERQRRAYFATNGFGRGIPYRRTGKLVKAWEVDINFMGDGGELTIENTAPSATYVIGERQQIFHKNTGWYQADDILLDEMIEVQDIIEDLWLTVTDESAGVR